MFDNNMRQHLFDNNNNDNNIINEDEDDIIDIDINKPTRFLILLTLLSCIGGFLFGYDTGIISGALVLLSDEDQFNLSETREELVVSITVGIAIIGALIGGPFSQYYGRKPLILICSFIYIFSSLLMSFATNFNILVIGRGVIGLAIGASSMCIPMYISECAPISHRGLLVTLVNVFITGGQFISSIIAGSFSGFDSGWRYMFGLAALPGLIQLIGFLSLPESPRWLIKNNKKQLAIESLKKMRGKHININNEIDEIINEIKKDEFLIEEQNTLKINYKAINNNNNDNINNNNNNNNNNIHNNNNNVKNNLKKKYNYFEIFEKKESRRALMVGCLLQFTQQFGGINSIMYYSGTLLVMAGFDTSTAIWLTALTSFMNFSGSTFGMYLVDKTGRRKLLLISLFLVFISLNTIALSFYLASEESLNVIGNNDDDHNCNSYNNCFDCITDDNCGYCYSNYLQNDACVSGDDDAPDNNSTLKCTIYKYDNCPGSNWTSWFIVLSMCFYLFSFAPGVGTMPWTINAEIYSLKVRSIGNSFSTFVNWTSNFIMSFLFLTYSSLVGKPLAFVTYGLICFFSFIWLYFYLPETQNIALENVENLFKNNYWGHYHKQNKFMDQIKNLINDNDNDIDNDNNDNLIINNISENNNYK